MPARPIIVWFRNDLRLRDHRALSAAVASGRPVLPLFIRDFEAAGSWAPGAASRWWLHHSLASLAASLKELGVPLVLKSGPSERVLAALADDIGAEAVFFSRAYEPWARAQEERVRAAITGDGREVKRFSGALLREPEDVRTKSGDPFKVYTPFWRAVMALGTPADPLPPPSGLRPPDRKVATEQLEDWRLLPLRPDWAGGLRETWHPGESGAHARCDRFVQAAISDYSGRRNFPGLEGTSRLSPHLHFGEISPNDSWHRAITGNAGAKASDGGTDTFLKEIAWREFSYHLLFHWPSLPEAPFRPEFARFAYEENDADLAAWQRGRTGYPIVDAGMRELWHTGWMHNRVRMIVASFLCKHLMIPWQAGEAWFWDTLVDADLASNSASWQWVAGSGADAAPYFRIFNPVTQGEKFDAGAAYVRRWVPEVARLPDDLIHAPWTASSAALQAAGITLGKTYPHPIVEHAAARQRALDRYAAMRA